MKENIGKSDIRRTHNLNIIPKVSNNTTKILLLAGLPFLLADPGKSVDTLLAEFIKNQAQKETVGKWLKEPKPTVFQYSQLESNQQFTLRSSTVC